MNDDCMTCDGSGVIGPDEPCPECSDGGDEDDPRADRDPKEHTDWVAEQMCDTGSVLVGTLWLIAAALLAANILFALGH